MQARRGSGGIRASMCALPLFVGVAEADVVGHERCWIVSLNGRFPWQLSRPTRPRVTLGQPIRPIPGARARDRR